MAFRMAPSYRFQTTQMNEESASKSYLDLMLTQHHCDEDPQPRVTHSQVPS